MPRKKSVAKKIFKCKRKEIDGDKSNYVIRWKGEWDTQSLRALRAHIDRACAEFMEELEAPKQEQQEDQRVRFRDEY